MNAFLSDADLEMKKANQEVMDSLVRIYKAKVKPLELVFCLSLPHSSFLFEPLPSRDTDLIISILVSMTEILNPAQSFCCWGNILWEKQLLFGLCWKEIFKGFELAQVLFTGAVWGVCVSVCVFVSVSMRICVCVCAF